MDGKKHLYMTLKKSTSQTSIDYILSLQTSWSGPDGRGFVKVRSLSDGKEKYDFKNQKHFDDYECEVIVNLMERMIKELKNDSTRKS
jgi:hypothetical protein